MLKIFGHCNKIVPVRPVQILQIQMFSHCLVFLHLIRSLVYGIFNCIMLHFKVSKNLFVFSRVLSIIALQLQLVFFEFSMSIPGFQPRISGFEFDHSAISPLQYADIYIFFFFVGMSLCRKSN